MNRKRYAQIRAAVAFFVSAIVALAVVRNSYLLASAGIFTGMVFLVLVRKGAKIKTDEREASVSEKAARITYAIFAPTLGIAAFFLLLPSKGGIAIFSKGEWQFTDSLGMIFAYLTLFLITVYSLSYYFFNRQYGGEEKNE